MRLFQDSERQLFFDKISAISQGSIEEYNRHFGAALADIAEIFGMVKVVCRVSVPKELSYVGTVPEDMVLFQGEGETETEPICFRYAPEAESAIEFFVHMEKGKSLPPDEEQELEGIFKQLSYVFEAFLLRLSCKKLIMTDSGTGIPNLKAFMQFCGMLAAREKFDEYTAFYFNIRNFKAVHKSLTYLEGNEVMKKYSQFVSGAVTKEEIVARLGADNFAALILNENIEAFLKLIQNVTIDYEKNGERLSFSFGATVGAASLSEERNAGEIMMHISAAYQSARERGIPLSYYEHGESRESTERKRILSRFDDAIREREFFVVYQPKVDAKSHLLLGAEALARWNRDDEYNMPMNFVPVLEKNGCITALDFYVLEEACKFIKKMRSEGMEPVRISVNFSKRHLSNVRLAEEIVDVIDRYEVPHGCIKVELTESEDQRDREIMKEIVKRLDEYGIKVAIDDFGTGYSSLAMLNTLQLDELKIDQSCIPQGSVDEKDKNLLMLKGVINLAKSLGLTIVAEGVETSDQLALIKSLGCDIVQGYIFDKPLSESEFIERIKQKQYVLGI